ncbi:hypothetical protein YC2023_039528 [Brassica napus]
MGTKDARVDVMLNKQIWSRFSYELEAHKYTIKCKLVLQWASSLRLSYIMNIEAHKKSVRGCIVSQDLSVLNLVIVKKGEKDLPGLTDTEKPRIGDLRELLRSVNCLTALKMMM